MASDVTVLVVEDDDAIQRQVRQTLRTRYRVLTATCWTQADEIRARTDVDVMVVDVGLTSSDRTGLDAMCADSEGVPVVLVARSDRSTETGTSGEADPPLLAF